MIGRNDPCSCGSGKKYKKCCATKMEVPLDTIIEDELDRVVSGVYEYPSLPAEAAEFDRYLRQWTRKLGDLWDRNRIEEAVSEYFLFVAKPEMWNRHLLKVRSGRVRSSVQSLLQLWMNPFVLFGKVIGEQDGYVLVEENLGNNTYQLKKEPGMNLNEFSIVFGVVLLDNRVVEDGVFVVTSLMFLQDRTGSFVQEIQNLAESSGMDKSIDFYKEHMVDIYEALLSGNSKTIEATIAEDLLPLQQRAVTLLEKELSILKIDVESLEVAKNIIVTYFLKEEPTFRKPEIIAAAAFQIVSDMGILDRLDYTQKEVAEIFSVSVGSMMKHTERIYEVLSELLETQEGSDQTRISYSVGTDPRMTESSNWEMYCKMSSMDFQSTNDAQAFLTETMHQAYAPKDEKETAQAMIYAAYDANDEKERYRLAKGAAKFHPENVDVLLLHAEIAQTLSEQETYFQSAIRFGKVVFDDEPDNPWRLVTNRPYMRALFSYGVWLFELERYAEASEQFKTLLSINWEDNQGARYLAIASFIHVENFDEANELLELYEEGSESDATYLFLKWFLEVKRFKGRSKDERLMLEEAQRANEHVLSLVGKSVPRSSYPKNLNITSGSLDEAKYIASLIK